MVTKILTIFLFYSFLFTTCVEDNDNNLISEIRYGTSFGMCGGYCKHDLMMSQNSSTYRCSGWTEDVAPITKTEKTDGQLWNSINNDLNLDAFFDLPEVIGCPDCADGGAEWLEIVLSTGETHKVTFEYFNEPASLKLEIELLREKLSENNCN